MTTPAKHHALLSKRPISKPSRHSRYSNPSAHLADLQLKSTIIGNRRHAESQKGETEDQEQDEIDEMEVPVIEFDSSKAPQPFLDGEEILERMKASGRAPNG
ncbi:hypothetical protein ACJ72_05309 [Emergomyces africanus]|uniref:Uncharacterized protein n=1 Tax=Emergomyces africanus TaxID=1955775 RepID=A0A1B7NUB0_9EURO|nr:hypothetical protein ACJ72_05309 [Emergomyces africanus]